MADLVSERNPGGWLPNFNSDNLANTADEAAKNGQCRYVIGKLHCPVLPPSSGNVSPRTNLNHGYKKFRTGFGLSYQPFDSISLMLSPFKTEAQVSQSASSTLLYFTSNGFLVAVVRSMS